MSNELRRRSRHTGRNQRGLRRWSRTAWRRRRSQLAINACDTFGVWVLRSVGIWRGLVDIIVGLLSDIGIVRERVVAVRWRASDGSHREVVKGVSGRALAIVTGASDRSEIALCVAPLGAHNLLNARVRTRSIPREASYNISERIASRTEGKRGYVALNMDARMINMSIGRKQEGLPVVLIRGPFSVDALKQLENLDGIFGVSATREAKEKARK
ncbi:hypothetical protein CERSUDRAFT_69849 [Gelatoporia subvermispora B]|uniref:Uncharacterized protein n=1 Tax=Ceriporiopsis subvermispora (strain B) TaxID=914234 RepID=M2QVW1_CERS8|nr:hypothetical protein CERSUDRAFT_69849 [Gelatoporia subvermispora B]